MTTARLWTLRTAFLVALCGVLIALPLASQAQENEQNVVIHLTHYTDDLHAVGMALKLGGILGRSGANVTIFTDLEGVRLADKRVPQDLRWGPGPPVDELYQALVDAGGRVMVCPHCARVAGLEESDLREGSSIATEEDMARLFLDADKILDY